MSKTLIPGFFKELSSDYSTGNTSFNVVVELDPLHPVYKGHFPQVPVAPGVCLVEMFKQILESKTQKQFRITEIDNVKFLALINPTEQKEFTLNYTVNNTEATNFITSVSCVNKEKTYVKFKGIFIAS